MHDTFHGLGSLLLYLNYSGPLGWNSYTRLWLRHCSSFRTCKHPLKLHPFHIRPKFVAEILFPWLVISVVLQPRLVCQVTARELASHACSGRPPLLLPYRMFFKANNNIATVRSSRGRSHSISRRYLVSTTGPTRVSARATSSIKSK